jgi:serine O-acetyltransferase
MKLCGGTSIEDITDSIVNSYKDMGGINHVGAVDLPTRSSIELVISKLEALIFPGFFSGEHLTESNLRHVTEGKVRDLLELITVQVKRNVLFNQTRDGQPLDESGAEKGAQEFVCGFLGRIPELRSALAKDVDALLEGDPAARTREEIIVAYPGLRAIATYRIAHCFWEKGHRLIARIMSEILHGETGIDIHPGATIGAHFYIDHGTGVVIGETTVIGEHVKIYQGVTLGGLSVAKKLQEQKRHPTLEDHVTVYAGATILGGDTTIGHHSVIGGNVWLVHSVPPHSRVQNEPRVRLGEKGKKPLLDWEI